MAKELEKVYDPKQVEDKLYHRWMQANYFHATVDATKKPYTIVIPPPNITGQLHMGHALDVTMQDAIIRWRRMQGYSALWLPGTDHASIATEAKIVNAMKEEGLTKDDLGRDKFLERAWEWKEKYGGRIVEQLKKLGSSCDWERERFTLDEGCNKAVNEVFVRLYEKGLIYRGERIINWCPHCLTSISEAEVEYEEQAGHFWHIRYPIVGSDQFIEVATTRPETMLGDTAVAVNPEDERYAALVGKALLLPLMNKEIPLIADSYVEQDFGTGCVKITPAHDPNDFEVGLRHGLEVINIMNPDGTINENGGVYAGLERYEARRRVVADLEAGGYLVKVEDYAHNVGACYRCGTTVEPLVSKQWFVKMEPLAKPAIDVVKNGEIQFVPDRFEKSYLHWMENTRDWCISRQLWWGHRIPVWYCADCGKITVARTPPAACSSCGSTHLEQDPDTLDTWFSSALWPFSTLGWPEHTPELDYFYPTSTLVTGYDIIGFWVSRMIFSGCEQMGKIPFDKVLIHGLIRDAQGRKMSKSLGNGIDPLEIIDQYGADTLRFTLATGNSPGNDMRFSEDKVKASRNFANKIWNASRFILMNLPEEITQCRLPDQLETEDKWVVSLYNRLVREVTDNLEKFELGIAVGKLYDFIWDILCDWYIELTKSRIQAGGATALAAQQVLVYITANVLKLLHPFMPFITEEIWQNLPHAGEGDSIMIAKWPEYDPALCFEREEADFQKVMDMIKAIRNQRSEMNIPPSKKAHVFLETAEEAVFQNGAPFFQRLASAAEVTVGRSFTIEGAVQVITTAARALIPMSELIDREKELARLTRERDKCKSDIEFIEKKLQNEGFLAKAPAQLVAGEKAKAAEQRERMAKIEESIQALG
ncbi:MAG: valine--tRNA ligase [Angelakisella sp.]